MKPLGILALQNIPGIGDKALKNILSLSSNANPSNPCDLFEIIKEARFKFNKVPLPDYSTVENGWIKAIEILDKSKENSIIIIGKDSPHYPSLLLDIENSPELLHIKGNINILNENGIAIIGTRKPTEYGIQQATNISEKFAEQNYVIISGLAKGIDAAAHEGALNVRGKTIAVLAHGLDTIYPKENKKLAERILDSNGVLVSEYFWGKRSTKGSFVLRNRIQSGLSLSVLVVETKNKGGTMHTVDYCNKQGRPLIVLENPKDPSYTQHYEGNIELIKDKIADLVLRKDYRSSKDFFIFNWCKDTTYKKDLSAKYFQKWYEHKTSNKDIDTICLNKLQHHTEIETNHYRIQSFLNYLLDNSFFCEFEYPKLNDTKLIKEDIREDYIHRKCEKCKKFNECKLVEEGFIDLCPFNNKDKSLSVSDSVNLRKLENFFS